MKNVPPNSSQSREELEIALRNAELEHFEFSENINTTLNRIAGIRKELGSLYNLRDAAASKAAKIRAVLKL